MKDVINEMNLQMKQSEQQKNDLLDFFTSHVEIEALKYVCMLMISNVIDFIVISLIISIEGRC